MLPASGTRGHERRAPGCRPAPSADDRHEQRAPEARAPAARRRAAAAPGRPPAPAPRRRPAASAAPEKATRPLSPTRKPGRRQAVDRQQRGHRRERGARSAPSARRRAARPPSVSASRRRGRETRADGDRQEVHGARIWTSVSPKKWTTAPGSTAQAASRPRRDTVRWRSRWLIPTGIGHRRGRFLRHDVRVAIDFEAEGLLDGAERPRRPARPAAHARAGGLHARGAARGRRAGPAGAAAGRARARGRGQALHAARSSPRRPGSTLDFLDEAAARSACPSASRASARSPRRSSSCRAAPRRCSTPGLSRGGVPRADRRHEPLDGERRRVVRLDVRRGAAAARATPSATSGLRYAETLRNLGPLAAPTLEQMLNLRMREQMREAVVSQAELQSGHLAGRAAGHGRLRRHRRLHAARRGRGRRRTWAPWCASFERAVARRRRAARAAREDDRRRGHARGARARAGGRRGPGPGRGLARDEDGRCCAAASPPARRCRGRATGTAGR